MNSRDFGNFEDSCQEIVENVVFGHYDEEKDEHFKEVLEALEDEIQKEFKFRNHQNFMNSLNEFVDSFSVVTLDLDVNDICNAAMVAK